MSWSAPEAGKTIPANAPAIVFTQGGGTIAAPITTAPVLKSATGTIATTVEGALLRPAAALPVGPLTLEYEENCTGTFGPDAATEKKQISFTVEAAAPLPTAIGTAAVTYARHNVLVPSGASCTEQLDAAVAKLAFTLDPAFAKFRSVARFITKVDGKPWATSAWGREGSVANPSPYFVDAGAPRPDLLFAACGAIPSGPLGGGLALGKHSVEVRAEIAGGETLPPITLEIDLRCGDAKPDSGTTVDATPDAAPETSTPAADPASGDSEGSGCSTTTRAPGNRATIALSFAALALVLARRRRALDTPRRDR